MTGCGDATKSWELFVNGATEIPEIRLKWQWGVDEKDVRPLGGAASVVVGQVQVA